MKIRTAWLAAALTCLTIGAALAQTAPLNSAAAATAVSPTDTLPICQNPDGCGTGDFLVSLQVNGILGTPWTWTAGQSVQPFVLTDGATIAIDASLSNNFILALSGNGHHPANPINVGAGESINIEIIQPASGCPAGGCQLAFDGTNSFWQAAGGTSNLVLSSTPGAVDDMYCQSWSSVVGHCSIQKNFFSAAPLAISHADGCKFQDTGTTATSISCTLAGTTLAGQSAVVYVAAHFPAGVSITTVTDNVTDTCTLAGSQAGTGWVVYAYVCQNLSAGATGFVANFSGTNTIGFETIAADTYNGLLTSGVILDGTAGNDQKNVPTTTNFVTSGPITTTTNNDLITGTTFLIVTGNPIAAGTGYAQRQYISNQTMTEDEILLSAGQVSTTFTLGGLDPRP